MRILPQVVDVVTESIEDTEIEKQLYFDDSFGTKQGNVVKRRFPNGAKAKYIYNDEYTCFAIDSAIGPHGEKFEWHKNGALKRSQHPNGLIFEYDEHEHMIYAKFTDDVECRWYRKYQSPADNYLLKSPKYDEIADFLKNIDDLTGRQVSGKFFLDPGDWDTLQDPPSYVKIPNEIERDCYENHSLKYAKYPDGSFYEWYKRRLETDKVQLKHAILPNGDEFEWNEKGQVIHEKHLNGDEFKWDDAGQLTYKHISNNSEKTDVKTNDIRLLMRGFRQYF